MIDTIILVIPYPDFRVLDAERFDPPLYSLNTAGCSRRGHVNNPTVEDKKNGVYMPRLTVARRPRKSGSVTSLKIEFSAPKILFRNNLDELKETDFSEVIAVLHHKLRDMGVFVGENHLRAARVSAVHFSKNIVLREGYTATFVIKELAKIDLSRRLDLTKIDFRNEGRSLQYYTASHSFVVYDKISDLSQPKARAIDKDQTKDQFSLFSHIQQKGIGLEVLRIEIRLSKRRKLKSILGKMGYSYHNDPLFQDVFRKELSQRVLKLYWNDVVKNQGLFIFEMNTNAQGVFKKILAEFPQLKLKEALYLVGLNLVCKDKGIRELRSLVEKHHSDRTWYRIKKDFKKLSQATEEIDLYGFVTDIEQNLSEFQSLKMDVLEN